MRLFAREFSFFTTFTTLLNHNSTTTPTSSITQYRGVDESKERVAHCGYFQWQWLGLIVLITLFTYPDTLQPVGRPTLNHVWYFGWISALSTGLGVLPLIFSPTLDSWWIGVTNGEFVVWFWFHLIRCDVMWRFIMIWYVLHRLIHSSYLIYMSYWITHFHSFIHSFI